MKALYRLSPGILRGIKRTFGKVRAMFFTKSVSERDMLVETDVETLEAVLGDHYFTNGWELSWHYKGEDLNMRRPKRKDDEYEWYQTHIRAFDQGDGTVKLELHEDLEPTEYPYYHLHPPDNANNNENAAYNNVAAILDHAGIWYEDLR